METTATQFPLVRVKYLIFEVITQSAVPPKANRTEVNTGEHGRDQAPVRKM
jgi:hypothetical protein